jgi:solute carrier family 25 (mitochondrial carrier protein), member 16
MFQLFPVLKFYRGFSATIIGMVPYAGTSFLVWGFLRSHFLPPTSQDSKGKRQRLHPVLDLTLGGIAGAVSQTASYPFEVVRRRMQVGGRTRPDRWLGWRETVQGIWSQRGFRGFFVGLGIGYLKVVPMTAVSYMVWETAKHALDV